MVKELTYRDDVLIEVAWVHEYLLKSNSYLHFDFDSLDAKYEIIKITKEFIKAYPEGVCRDNYYEEVMVFAEDKLMKWNRENYIS